MISIESALPRLNEFIERQTPTLNAPGIAIGLTYREHILHVGVYGLANQEAGKTVTPKTLFQIGSISKSFTSIVLLQLQEQGLLDINDPVTKYLPWFEIQSEYDPITLRHLMSHTAGIITGSDETVSAYTETWNLRYTKATAPPADRFLVPHPAFELFPLQFGRENDQITEATYGRKRYVRDGYQGETSFASLAEWEPFPGHYRSHNPWLSNFRVVLRKGSLVLIFPSGKDQLLHQLEPGLFRIGDDPRSPEFIRFDVVISGKTMQAILSGGAYSRTFTL